MFFDLYDGSGPEFSSAIHITCDQIFAFVHQHAWFYVRAQQWCHLKRKTKTVIMQGWMQCQYWLC